MLPETEGFVVIPTLNALGGSEVDPCKAAGSLSDGKIELVGERPEDFFEIHMPPVAHAFPEIHTDVVAELRLVGFLIFIEAHEDKGIAEILAGTKKVAERFPIGFAERLAILKNSGEMGRSFPPEIDSENPAIFSGCHELNETMVFQIGEIFRRLWILRHDNAGTGIDRLNLLRT